MDKYSEGSLDPFLSQDDDHVTIRQSKRYSGKSQGVKRNGLLVAVLLCLVYISIGLTYEIAWSAQHNCSRQRDSRFTLTGDILEYEDRKEWYKQGHPWDLPPSDEIDEAWDKLLFSLNIRVSPEEMSSIGANTTNRVQVNHGDYLGALGVFHYLHCLNNLRKVIHWDYYGPSLEGVPTMGKEHSSHCIDILRQAVMCHANVQIDTAEWVNEDNLLGGKEIRKEAVTTCVKWDSLDRWARPRALRPGEFSYRPGPFYHAHIG